MAYIGHLLKVYGLGRAPIEVIWLMLGHKTEGIIRLILGTKLEVCTIAGCWIVSSI
jgi:hypothetical protein